MRRKIDPLVSLAFLFTIIIPIYYPYSEKKFSETVHSFVQEKPANDVNYETLVSQVSDSEHCDLFLGEWVPNPEGPYYKNMSCSNAIDLQFQNCMKFGRPDTDFFKWKWKPDACELPMFEPRQFLEIVRGKSLAFVGDSYIEHKKHNKFFHPAMFYLNHHLIGCQDCVDSNVSQLTSCLGYRKAFRTSFRDINNLKNYKGVTILRTFSPSHFEMELGTNTRTMPFRRNEKVLEDITWNFTRSNWKNLGLLKKKGGKETVFKISSSNGGGRSHGFLASPSDPDSIAPNVLEYKGTLFTFLYLLVWTVSGTKSFRKSVHLSLQFMAFFLSLIGLWAAWKFHIDKGIDNWYSLHSWLGLACLFLFGVQQQQQQNQSCFQPCYNSYTAIKCSNLSDDNIILILFTVSVHRR
ncbi:hypothetical protein RND71_034168 [Anisodus tanguticus]|uniref:Uncharacterized protein n=1 Tax=Anisodus tanguticus TaxID=243964 RepID=A0AAE1V3X7_9SOLA|nr:hypothetical protein RND71_034168 [Anisodus tanguticus]